MEEVKKNKHLVFWILFPLGWTLVTLFLIFFYDLTNGPLAIFIIQLVVLAAFFVIRLLFINKKFLYRILTWAAFLSITIVLIAFDQPVEKRKSAAYYKNPELINEPLVLNEGKVQGFYNVDKKVKVYAGIPYAKAERWKEAKPYHWDDVIDGRYFAPKSMQPKENPITNTLVTMYSEKAWHPNYLMEMQQNRSEDGLYLNIWRPNTEETDLPILVYIHGGSLTSGSGGFDDYNGESMAKLGVIMITIQYRLGVFGYFAHPSLKEESLHETGHATTGNYGLLDQIFALKWINDNASNFGGDKNNITIAGESAGSSSVSAICSSPLAKNLFKRAIGESSSLVIKKAPHTYRTLEKGYETSENILKEFKCKTIDELRKVSAKRLTETKFANSSMTLDGYALTKDPYQVYLDHENNEEALLNGYNLKESDAFVVPTYLTSPTNKRNILGRLKETFNEDIANRIYELYKDKIEKDAFTAFNEIISVYWFIMPHHTWSNLAINNGVKVYRYLFTKENGYHATYHSGEMVYCYGNIARQNRPYAYNDSDYKLQNIMLNYWANFAKSGNPNGEGLPTWNEYQNNGDKVMELGSSVGPINDEYLPLYDIISDFIDATIEDI